MSRVNVISVIGRCNADRHRGVDQVSKFETRLVYLENNLIANLWLSTFVSRNSLVEQIDSNRTC